MGPRICIMCVLACGYMGTLRRFGTVSSGYFEQVIIFFL